VKSLRTILQLGKGWEITPAGGATGEAYIAESKDKKLKKKFFPLFGCAFS
jgi:hypothetical protein